MTREKIIVAIHGILTAETSKTWPARLEIWVWENRGGDFEVVKREYFGWPLPIIQVFIRNKFFIAPAFAEYLADYYADDADISFVTHSNGADVAVEVIKALCKRGYKTRALIAIGAAIQADIDRSGIAQLIDSGALGRAVAYCSRDDSALALKVRWPYGDLGRQGFTCEGLPFSSDRVQTRWFPGFDHSTYFDTAHQDATFESAVADIGSSTTGGIP